MLWDTAGQEEFDAITKAYYRGAQACVLAFSTTDRDSFEAAHSWKMKVLTDPVTTEYQVSKPTAETLQLYPCARCVASRISRKAVRVVWM